MDKTKIIQTITDYLKRNRVREIAFFGSFARNEMTPSSDIDVLVEYTRGTTLFDIVRMQLELSEKIGRKIDLVSKNAIKKDLMKYIKKDLQLAYHEGCSFLKF